MKGYTVYRFMFKSPSLRFLIRSPVTGIFLPIQATDRVQCV